MKIAFNAIRVSNKAGSGFDTFIINFINEFAKYVYENPQLNIEFDIYTLCPYHFKEVKKENIKQIKLPFIKQKNNVSKQSKNNSFSQKSSIFSYFLLPIYFIFADYFRMFWTQCIFPFYTKDYNLIICLTEYEGFLFRLYKQVVIIHNTVPFLFSQFGDKYKFYTYNLLPKIMNKCRHIVTVSNVLKKELVEIFKIPEKKISVIYEGVDNKTFFKVSIEEIEKFKKLYNIKEKFILAVGHSHPIKNFNRILRAYEILKKVKKINLVIAGYLNKNFEFKEGVIYVGHISNNRLNLLYSSAECFVFSTLHEGFGLPPLEAMMCGCPVVVSDRGSLPEVCGDAAVYVNPYDPQSIAEGILKVLTNESLRQQLIKKGFEQAKKFTWKNSVEKFIELLKNLQNNDIK